MIETTEIDSSDCEVTIVDFPELPKIAQVTTVSDADVCPWLTEYTNFSRRMSPRAYDGFHESIGLWIMSTIAARRVGLTLGTKDFHPALYIALTAHTTIFSKTTTVNVAHKLLKAAGLDFLLAPDDSTPQAFVNDMCANVADDFGTMSDHQKTNEIQRLAFAGQRGWAFEEFGMKIEAMMRNGGFMADFRGMLKILDDGKEAYTYKTMTRRDVVEMPYLALLANMTPADLRPYAAAGSALWNDGFLAREAFVTPPPGLAPKQGRFPKGASFYPEGLIRPLAGWHRRLGMPDIDVSETQNSEGKGTGRYHAIITREQPKQLILPSETESAFYNYHDGLLGIITKNDALEDLFGSYGRFAEKAMRVAILITSLAGDDEISLGAWARAQNVAETWRKSLHNLMSHLEKESPSQERKDMDKILSIIERFPDGATPGKLSQYDRKHSTSEIADLCYRMEKDGSIGIVGETRKNTPIYGILT